MRTRPVGLYEIFSVPNSPTAELINTASIQNTAVSFAMWEMHPVEPLNVGERQKYSM